MKARKGELKGVSDLIENASLPGKVKDHLKNHSIWSKWSEIVGPELYRVTQPLEIKGHSLVIQVAHQAWAQQLHFLRPSILGKIRTHCPNSKLKDLQFRIGEVDHPEGRQLPKLENLSSKKTSSKKLSERQEMTLRAVDDPQLRESIRKAMEAEASRSD